MKQPTSTSPVAVFAVLLLIAPLYSCAPPAREDASVTTEDTAVDRAAVVTYAFSVLAPKDEMAPSGPLITGLAQDPNLGRLTVEDASDRPNVRALEAEFVFGTVDAFRAWQDQAAPLLDRVATLTPDSVAFQPQLSVRRPALYQSVVGRVEARTGAGGREAESVTCNEDCSRIDVTYRTKANEAGGGGTGQGTGDAGDIDAVTLICQPGLAGTIESCTASN